MIRAVVVLVFAGLGLAACVIPLAGPPMRVDVGHTWQRGVNGTRVAAGLSLGSLVKAEDLPLDAGMGLLFDDLSSGDGMKDTSTSGKYVDAAVVVHRWGFVRALAGVRYENYNGGTYEDATKLRLDLEVLGHTEATILDSGGSGKAYGNGGIGVYAEGGPAWTPDRDVAWTATVGVSVRLPAWGVIVIEGPGSGHSSGGSGSFRLSGSSGSGSSR